MRKNLILQTLFNICENTNWNNFYDVMKPRENSSKMTDRFTPKAALNNTKVHLYQPWRCPSTLRKSYINFLTVFECTDNLLNFIRKIPTKKC